MNRVIVNADQPGSTIDKHVYGHFAEHLGRCVYDGIWVGEESPIPNVRGIRSDVVEALKRIKVPVIRWPGGCFADEYHWEDGIGPRADRPSMINTHWGQVVESNAFGTHEFFDLCGLLEADPYVCGNLGSGTVREMQQWVEYLTAVDGPMADLRRKNGRDKPWALPYFGSGNENWGCGGNMRSEYYADLYRRYTSYVRNLNGNKIAKIACGSNSDDYRWTKVLMGEASNHMDGLSLHYYTVPGSEATGRRGPATGFGEEEWFITLQKALVMDRLICNHSTIMDLYDPDKRVALVVDEWGTWYDAESGTNPSFLYQQNSMRDALVAGLTLNIFNTHCDRVRMANIAQTVNVLQALILTNGPAMITTPTYHVFDLYRVHQGATALPCFVDADPYTCKEQQIPQVNASASRDGAGQINVTLCNTDPNHPAAVSSSVHGVRLQVMHGRVLTGDNLDAHNTFQDPRRVRPEPFREAQVTADGFKVTLPPMSVVLLSMDA